MVKWSIVFSSVRPHLSTPATLLETCANVNFVKSSKYDKKKKLVFNRVLHIYTEISVPLLCAAMAKQHIQYI